MALIKLEQDVRERIGRLLLEYVNAGLAVQGRMPQWWAEVERVYRNEAPGDSTIAGDSGSLSSAQNKGYHQFHVPLSQPRQDMLTAQVATVITKQFPYMTDLEGSEEIAFQRQKLGHSVWKDAGFESKVRDAATITGNTDIAYFRICPSSAQRASIDIDVLHPDQVIVYPALPQGIQAAACVGHQLYLRRYIVDSMMDDKTYYRVENIPVSSQDEHDLDYEQAHTGTDLGVTSPSKENELVEVWPLIVRLDLDRMKNPNSTGDAKESLYRATLDYKGGQLLCLEPYEKSYIWYFRTAFIGSPREFYSGNSVARNLYAVQNMYNSLWSGFFGGAMQAASGGPIFGENLLSAEKYTTFGMNTLVETDSPVEPWAPNVHFDGQPFPTMIAACERIADQIARISQNTQGAQATGQTTATEQSIIAAGVAVGLEEYIARFTQDFPAMMAHTMELIADDYEGFSERYGDPEQIGDIPLSPQLGDLGAEEFGGAP